LLFTVSIMQDTWLHCFAKC